MDKNTETKFSKFLSLVLRHKPEEISLSLDENGWADVNELLEKIRKTGKTRSKDDLRQVVANNEKKRFTFNEDETKIRANQGHSITVDLDLEAIEPPEFLFHGTAEQNLKAILDSGIQKMKRQHVHLSKDKGTATTVGSRHGKPIVLIIKSGEMFRNGIAFYISKNGVWLTEFVESKYIVN